MSVPDHLTTVAGHARALATRGDLRGAQAMLDQALEPATAMLGPDHPEVLAATRLLASLHRDLGDLSNARRLLEEALAAGQFTLGEESPALLPLSYDLAMLADELGNRHEARRNFTRLMRYGPATLGPDHEYVRAARRYLGVATPPPDPASPTTPPDPASPTTPPDPASPTTPGPAAGVPARPSPPPPADLTPPGDLTQTTPPRATPPPTRPVVSTAVSPALPAPYAAPPSAPRWSPRDSDDHDERRHSRAPMLALVLVATMALVGGIAVYLVSRAPAPGPSPRAGASSAATDDALDPPGQLKLRDDGSSITLTWTDPSKGTVPFIVAGGRADNALNPLGSVESGKTTYTLNGVSSTVDYCFLVAAVYSSEHTVPSALVCTKRTGTSPSPPR